MAHIGTIVPSRLYRRAKLQAFTRCPCSVAPEVGSVNRGSARDTQNGFMSYDLINCRMILSYDLFSVHRLRSAISGIRIQPDTCVPDMDIPSMLQFPLRTKLAFSPKGHAVRIPLAIVRRVRCKARELPSRHLRHFVHGPAVCLVWRRFVRSPRRCKGWIAPRRKVVTARTVIDLAEQQVLLHRGACAEVGRPYSNGRDSR
jgi:hypothetical protein